MKIKFLLLAIPFFLFWQAYLGEKETAEKIAQTLDYWNSNYPQEKVFLQADKKQYVAGEEIWFKTYCTLNSKPTFLSRIIYVDIVNEKGIVIEKKMLRIDSLGTAHGFLTLNKDLPSGNYSINAYTLWMLNFPQFITKVPIYLYGKDYTQKIRKAVQPTVQMQFFPEGGTFIAGIKNKIAFKVNDDIGTPLQIKGTITTSTGTSITDFITNHDGMGSFEIEPKFGETYNAAIDKGNGRILNFKLPNATKEGIHLTIQNTKNRIFALVNRSEENKDKYNNLLLAAHINGQLVYMGAFDFNEAKTAAAIPKKGLPAGILHITLFDTTAKPLAERLAFVDNHSIIQPKVTITKKDVNKRGKNIVTFSVDSIKDASLSVLVKNGEIDNDIYLNENIASRFLLTSDIKGYVNNPGYYFANKADTTLQNLDLLLLTQGWRRFVWNDVLVKKEINLKYPIESNISIKGKVTKSDRQAVIANGKVSMIIRGEDSTKILADAYLTDKGEFILDSINFRQKATVYYEGQNNKKEKLPVDVTIYKSYIDTLNQSTAISTINLDTADITNRRNPFTSLIYGQIATIDTLTFGLANLAEVTVRTKKLSRIDSLQRAYVTSAFEMSDQTIDFKDSKGMVNIWQYLRMQISGFEVEPFNGGASSARFTRFDGAAGLSQDIAENGIDGILFMLNEIPVDGVFIDNILPEEVALVKVYKGNTAFPWGASRGMIAIYTKKGVDVKSTFGKSFNKMEILGYATSREFYSPNYEKYPLLNKNLTDKRQTLYWQPNIKKSVDGTYSVQFFNNDVSNKFKLQIQGIDKNGALVFKELMIE